ncbi:MAG: 6-bladed beta-propeller [Spirochaetales bacterium]|nr:6-bladed beta-propeller [Spirochaetales bacterium]
MNYIVNKIVILLLIAVIIIIFACSPDPGESSPAVSPISSQFILKWGANGGDGTSGLNPGEFYYPSDVTVDSGSSVYVIDYNGRIQKFGLWTGYEREWDTYSGSPLNISYGIAIDSNDIIYAADTYNDRICKFSVSGSSVGTWGTSGAGNSQFDFPYGVEVYKTEFVVVADNNNHRIQQFDTSGTFIRAWGSEGTGNGEFKNPSAAGIDSQGNIYIADKLNHRIQKFDKDGVFLLKWGKNGGDGTSGTGNGEFNQPKGITVDSNDFVYVSDAYNHRIQVFDADGGFKSTWGNQGDDDGNFQYPHGLAAVGTKLIVVDGNNHRIQVFGE